MTRRASIKRCPDDRGHPKILLLCDLSAMLLPSSRLSRTEPIMFISGPSTHPTPNFPLCDLCAMLSSPLRFFPARNPPCSPAVLPTIHSQICPLCDLCAMLSPLRVFPAWNHHVHQRSLDPSNPTSRMPLCDAFLSSLLSRTEPPCSPAILRPIQPQFPSVTSVRCFSPHRVFLAPNHRGLLSVIENYTGGE